MQFPAPQAPVLRAVRPEWLPAPALREHLLQSMIQWPEALQMAPWLVQLKLPQIWYRIRLSPWQAHRYRWTVLQKTLQELPRAHP